MAKKDPELSAWEAVDVFTQVCEKNQEPIFVGIDPGADGAIGFLCGTAAAVIDIPTFKVDRKRQVRADPEKGIKGGTKKGTKTVFNLPEIVAIFDIFNDHIDTKRLQVALEEGQIQIKGKGANAYNGFRVGVAFGLWTLFLCEKGYSVEEVHPAKWKKAAGLIGKDKEHSRKKALGLWPALGKELSRKSDHNRAEALLLADWMRKQRGGSVSVVPAQETCQHPSESTCHHPAMNVAGATTGRFPSEQLATQVAPNN